jgi:ribulose-phosphate 3-epimerase
LVIYLSRGFFQITSNPMKSFKISASILSADFTHLGDQIKSAEDAGVDWLHVDVMDGHFVPNITMGPFIVETCKRVTSLPLDIHLMIDHPEKYINSFAVAGADWISIHYENNQNRYRTIQEIKNLGCRSGIVINPGTPVHCLTELIESVDLVLIMSVNPGFSGQVFIPATSRKIQQTKNLLLSSNSPALIQVDGGITPQTIHFCLDAGADVIVAATSIFKHPRGIALGVESLRLGK